jgi:hypothetical protein
MLKRLILRCTTFLFATGVCSLVGGLSWGAESSTPTNANKSKVSAGTNDSGATNMDEIDSETVRITAKEAKEHGLPPAEITIILGESGLSGMKFPDKGEYLSLSGPPGGPLGLVVLHIESVPKNNSTWHELIEKRYPERSATMGRAGEIKIGDEKYSAYTFSTDSGPARAHHLLIVFAVPDSKEAILVDFYRAAGKSEIPTPQSLATDEKFSEILPSLSIRFE